MARKRRLDARAWPHLALAAALAAAACEDAPSDRVQGYVEGEFVYVASPLAGELEQLAVQRGAQVREGDLLFVLEHTAEVAARDEAQRRLDQARAELEDARKGQRPSEIASLEAQLQQVQASLALSRVELDRQELVAKTGATAKADLDRAQGSYDRDLARVAQLEADLATARLGSREDLVEAAAQEVAALEAVLEQAEWDLAQKRQSATQAGLAFDTLYREGEWVEAGRPVVVLLPPPNVKVRAFAKQALAATIQVGDSVRVFADGVAEPFTGRVSFISPQVEYTPPVIYSRESREKLVVLIEARFDDATASRLHPGQPVDVAFGP